MTIMVSQEKPWWSVMYDQRGIQSVEEYNHKNKCAQSNESRTPEITVILFSLSFFFPKGLFFFKSLKAEDTWKKLTIELHSIAS